MGVRPPTRPVDKLRIEISLVHSSVYLACLWKTSYPELLSQSIIIFDAEGPLMSTLFTRLAVSAVACGLLLTLPACDGCSSPEATTQESPTAPVEPASTGGDPEATEPPALNDLHVNVGEVDALGSLSADRFGPVLNDGKEALSQCLRRAHQTTEGLPAGTLTLSLIIARDGRVGSAFVVGSDLRNDALDRCVSDAAREWSFPAVDDGITRLLIPLQLPAPQ